MRVVVSPETTAMVEWAKGQLRAMGRRPTFSDALDWLLRDACEYGSPIVGAQARKTWPNSAETASWERRQPFEHVAMALSGRAVES